MAKKCKSSFLLNIWHKLYLVEGGAGIGASADVGVGADDKGVGLLDLKEAQSWATTPLNKALGIQ